MCCVKSKYKDMSTDFLKFSKFQKRTGELRLNRGFECKFKFLVFPTIILFCMYFCYEVEFAGKTNLELLDHNSQILSDFAERSLK